MTNEEKIKALRAMVEDEVERVRYSDDVLDVYLSAAGRRIVNRVYPYRDDETEVPERYEHIQIEIAAYLLNKRGAEGETAHSENGISRSYEDADGPASMLREITPYCGVFT